MSGIDYSLITDNLYVGQTPEVADYPLLAELGVRLVINMRVEQRPYPDPYQTGIQFLWIPVFDFPLFPIPLTSLARGVRAALPVLNANSSVYAHCAAGKHRGAAMGAAILIGRGYPPRDALELVKQQRPFADPQVWYIRWRVIRFASYWAAHTDHNTLIQ